MQLLVCKGVLSQRQRARYKLSAVAGMSFAPADRGDFMTRSIAKLSAALFLFAASAIVAVGAVRADEGKCTLNSDPNTPTGRACAKGGRAEAKRVMKEMVKVAKANGQKFTCDGCHKDLDNYALTQNATEEYKKLEAAQTKK
jgi:hypothetical protein